MEEKEKIINIPVEDILPNRFQPRLAFDENELNTLSNSIRKYGVLQPVILRQIGDKYEIIAGERRYKATVQAGLKTIPAIIKNSDDNTSAEIALLENLQRKNLTVIEEAQSFKKLLDRGFTQEEVANKLGISQSSIANKIRLLNLPRKVQDALLFNKISERHARSLLSLNDKELQENLVDRIVNEKLTVRQTEEEISKLLNNYKVEDDIPSEIRKYIERDDIDYLYEDDRPEVVEIKNPKISIDEDKPIVNITDEKEVNDTNEINPFQIHFQDNIKRIEKELENKHESYYDKIIDNDFKNTNFDYLEPEEEETQTENIPNVITKVRSFVNNIESNSIETKEEDLPDKYRIIIEIKKDN